MNHGDAATLAADGIIPGSFFSLLKKRLLWDMIWVASAPTHGGFIFVEPVLLHPHIFFSVIVAASHIKCQRLYFQLSHQCLSPLTMGPPGPPLGFLPML